MRHRVSARWTPIAPATVRRVLVRCPNWLGDTVMAVPTIQALRAALPDAEVWCLGPWVEAILGDEPGIARRLAVPPAWRERLALAGRLRRAGVDLALLLPGSFESALAAWMAGARRRVGYAGDGRTRLLTHPVAPPEGFHHQVDAYLALLAPLGVRPAATVPTLRVSLAGRVAARRLLRSVGVQPGDRAVGIQLGAAFGASKLWPAVRLGALAVALEGRGVPTVFLGGASAMPLLAAVEASTGRPVRSLVGRDRPALLPALLAELGVLVAPDSGPAHVAAAVGVPVVALFGPTDPRLTAPVGDRHAAVWAKPACAPCFLSGCPIDHRCMEAIDVDDVLRAVLERLGVPS